MLREVALEVGDAVEQVDRRRRELRRRHGEFRLRRGRCRAEPNRRDHEHIDPDDGPGRHGETPVPCHRAAAEVHSHH